MPVFLFSDIEGSTKKWEQHQDAMSRALVTHDDIIQKNVTKYGGEIIKHTGDGFFAVFEHGDPIRCALSIQKEIAGADWGPIGELRVRIALHAGYAEKRMNDYFGPVINRTARILGIAWGGQILATPEVLNSCSLPPEVVVKELGKHMLKDLGEPQLLYCITSPDLKIQEFPPLRSLTAHIHNLPVQSTPFLGREKELAEIEHLLQIPDCRLLTIIGPGGIGKSRLALQAAADMIEIFPQGIFVIPLAPLTSIESLISAVAEQIKFNFYSKQDPKTQLISYLSEKKMLLIFDNFEHIIEGASIITEILKNAPQVKIIVTSRQMLNLQGEWLHQLQGLEVPETETVDIENYSAVQLFLQSARRFKADFSPSEGDISYVIRICQLVSGIPLGIELASSWLRILSLEEITKEIEKSFDFLTSKIRDLPERHQSLRAVFEYSWQLLSNEEKKSLARLSVFPRKFSRDAAEKIAGATLSLLSLLIDKSLLIRDSSGYYEIIGVLRQYAREKLSEFPEEQTNTRNMFCEYYAEFISTVESEMQSNRVFEIASVVNRELDNIRAAWSTIIDQQNNRLIEKAVSGIFYIYDTNGWLKEGSEIFQKIIDRLEEERNESEKDAGSPLLGKLYTRQAMFLYQLGNYDRARELLNLSLKIARKYENKKEMGACYNTMGNISYMLSDFEHAKKMYNSWLEIATELNLQKGIAGAYNNLGVIAYRLREYEKAKDFFEKSRHIAEAIGYEKGIAFADTNIALVLHATGKHQEARKIFLEALKFDQKIGDKISIANTLNNLGLVYKALEEYDNARKVFEESLAIRRETGDRMGMTIAYVNLGELDYLQGEYEKALLQFQEWSKISKELKDSYSETASYVQIARTYLALENYELARKYYLDALHYMKTHHYSDYLHHIMFGFASILMHTTNKKLALELLYYIIDNEKSEKQLLKDAEKLRDVLVNEIAEKDRIIVQKNAKSSKGHKYIKVLSTIFQEKTARKKRTRRTGKN